MHKILSACLVTILSKVLRVPSPSEMGWGEVFTLFIKLNQIADSH